MARRFAYLTPDNDETQTIVSRCLSVPLPLLPHVVGALSELTNVWQWEQFGTMSPEDAAQLAAVMLNDFSGACDAMTCEEIIQCVLASGILQAVSDDALKRVVGGVPQWSPDGVIWYDMPLAGDGSPNVPALQPTSGANDDAKICLAATRAVLVINELYGGVFGAVGNGLHTALNDFSRFLRELNHSLLGLLYGESWQILNAAILQDVDIETHYVNPSLAGNVLEELLCLLVSNAAVDAAGIVTFDYGAVRANVVSDTNLVDGTAIWGLLGYIGADGLNVAGSTHITDTPMNCAPCAPIACVNVDFGFEDADNETWGFTDTSFPAYFAEPSDGRGFGAITTLYQCTGAKGAFTTGDVNPRKLDFWIAVPSTCQIGYIACFVQRHQVEAAYIACALYSSSKTLISSLGQYEITWYGWGNPSWNGGSVTGVSYVRFMVVANCNVGVDDIVIGLA